jgi:catechol 2,3-dioxygenase-like lactoylglutathione lyase family enzyme
VGVIGFREEWRPDPNTLYLRLHGDNLALHKFVPKDEADERAFAARAGAHLGHLGIVVRRMEDVDEWHAHLIAQGVTILAAPRTHRDGARSLYCADPDDNAVQILYHPPISEAG